MCQCSDNVKVSLLVWRTRYTDTFCNAVDYRFELALEVQRWTRARSECLPWRGGQNYSYATVGLLGSALGLGVGAALLWTELALEFGLRVTRLWIGFRVRVTVTVTVSTYG